MSACEFSRKTINHKNVSRMPIKTIDGTQRVFWEMKTISPEATTAPHCVESSLAFYYRSARSVARWSIFPSRIPPFFFKCEQSPYRQRVFGCHVQMFESKKRPKTTQCHAKLDKAHIFIKFLKKIFRLEFPRILFARFLSLISWYRWKMMPNDIPTMSQCTVGQ